MTRKVSAVCVLTFALATLGSAQTTASSAGSGTHYTKAQLKQLVQNAHTPSQYEMLASYFGQQQKSYLAQAADEKQEWVRRSANIVSTAAKYPRPVDSAHYLYDYYTYMASESGQQAARYAQLAAPSSGSVN
jgi:hypothetical protein